MAALTSTPHARLDPPLHDRGALQEAAVKGWLDPGLLAKIAGGSSLAWLARWGWLAQGPTAPAEAEQAQEEGALVACTAH